MGGEMIELSDADFQYDGEDIGGLAVAQLVALVAGVLAVVVLGSYYVGIADTFGEPLRLPYSGLLGPALAVAALAGAAAIPARFSRVWSDARGRKRIVSGLGQMTLTALVALVAGVLLAGARLDALTANQLVQAWLYYGLIVAGVVQLLVALAAFVLLILQRDLPDFVD